MWRKTHIRETHTAHTYRHAEVAYRRHSQAHIQWKKNMPKNKQKQLKSASLWTYGSTVRTAYTHIRHARTLASFSSQMNVFFFCVFNFSKTCRIVVIHYKRPYISSMAHNTILHARIHFCLRVFGESQDHTMPVKCICDCIIALIESNKTESNHYRRPLRNIRYVATIPAIPFRCHSVWWWQCFLCSNSMRSVSNRTSKLSHIILGRYRTADWEWETWKRQMQSRTIVGCAKHGGEHASRLRPW